MHGGFLIARSSITAIFAGLGILIELGRDDGSDNEG
jgi:hypothetical protein